MGFLSRIFGGENGGAPARAPRRAVVRAKYDAAAKTPANAKHWAGADGYSPVAALPDAVRKTLRERCRYEVANNSYAKGIVLTLANDLVGTGARLQLSLDEREVSSRIEAAWSAWANEVRLADKMRLLRTGRAESGEVFAVLAKNDAMRGPIKLDLRLVESEQVQSIEYDDFGNPKRYFLLKEHPGNTGQSASTGAAAMAALESHGRWIDAASVIHYYRAERPGQLRGIPDVVPALYLFGQLRRYTMAVIECAETAANYAGVLYTDSPANETADDVEPMDTIEVERNSFLTMPAGWKMGQLKAEQPTTTYEMFKNEILNEVARCLNMPFNVAAGNSSKYNYASGRLDHQVYHKSLRIEQQIMADTVLDRVFSAWIAEAILISDLVPAPLRSASFEHDWMWDGQEHVDPLKEANAQAKRLENGTTTLASEYAKQGKDWETELRQRARELALIEELGLSMDESDAATVKDEDNDNE
jgi:lambda family phage portal protein